MKNLELTARSNEFGSIIANTSCANNMGKKLDIETSIRDLITQFLDGRDQGNAVYLIGNGGSAGIASHALTDFVNVCRLRAFTLHDSSLITCMANDFGYENAFARILSTVMKPNDILIAISSSGKSANICNAANVAMNKGGFVITLSGFHQDNPLRKLGDINFWLNSSDYGMVEIGHQFILHNIADRIGYEAKKLRSMNVTLDLATL